MFKGIFIVKYKKKYWISDRIVPIFIIRLYIKNGRISGTTLVYLSFYILVNHQTIYIEMTHIFLYIEFLPAGVAINYTFFIFIVLK